MRYRWRELPSILRSRQGRKSMLAGQLARFWPVIRIFTTVYRRIVLRNVRVVAVIGSLGKSTTTRAVAAAIGHREPDGVSNALNALAFDLLNHSPWSSHAVLEAGINGPGFMKKWAAMLHPDIVVVTSIASDHILSFGTLENTRNEKAEMLRGLSPEKTAILNADDPNVMWMAGQTEARIVTCGFSDTADVRALNFEILPSGSMSFLIEAEGQFYPIRVSVLGRHMVFPILAAVAVALFEKKDLSETCRVLEKIHPQEGRMQTEKLASGAVLIRDDFKSNMESVQAALDTLKEYPAKRKILVLGGVSEIKNSDRYEYYRKLGKEIASSTDYSCLFLRKNNFRRCRNEAVAAGMDSEKIKRVGYDPLEAVSLLPAGLGDGDVILVKGRSEHRTARLSLHLMGRCVQCRLPSCHIAVDCEKCELLEHGSGNSPLTGVNRTRN